MKAIRKKGRRLLSLFIVFAMMAGMLPAGVFAYTDLEVNEIQTESEPQTETESETEQQAAEQFLPASMDVMTTTPSVATLTFESADNSEVEYQPGFYVGNNDTLTYDGTETLTFKGGHQAAGIGGKGVEKDSSTVPADSLCGNMIFGTPGEKGDFKITAHGGEWGSGIGDGDTPPYSQGFGVVDKPRSITVNSGIIIGYAGAAAGIGTQDELNGTQMILDFRNSTEGSFAVGASSFAVGASNSACGVGAGNKSTMKAGNLRVAGYVMGLSEGAYAPVSEQNYVEAAKIDPGWVIYSYTLDANLEENSRIYVTREGSDVPVYDYVIPVGYSRLAMSLKAGETNGGKYTIMFGNSGYKTVDTKGITGGKFVDEEIVLENLGYTTSVTLGTNMSLDTGSGALIQEGKSGTQITPIKIKADSGYQLPESWIADNGLTYTRDTATTAIITGSIQNKNVIVKLPDAEVFKVDTLAEAKAEAKVELAAKLGTYKQGSYSASNWTALNKAKTDGDSAIDNAGKLDGVTSAKNAALAAMDAVKTLAEEAAYALAAAKLSAKADLATALVTYTQSSYSASNWTVLTAAKTDGDVAIENATDTDGVTSAKEAAIAAMDAVKTKSSSSGGSSPSTPPQQDTGNSLVTVNGQSISAGTETSTTEDGKTTTSVQVKNEVVESKIEEAIKNNTTDGENTIQISSSDKNSEVVAFELTGDTVKKLENNNFDVSVKNNNIEYIIPAKEITISKVAEELNILEKDLKEIKTEIRITKPDEETIKKYNQVAKDNGSEIIFPPVSFEVVANTTRKDGSTQEVTISKFSNYVERVMEIPAGVDQSKITTGIVFNQDGSYSHVPTQVFEKGGKWYAKIKSLTNSTYSVIWNPVTVKSVENHWSKNTVNEMASRLIIRNPETFMPQKSITRADFAEYIIRALGIYREGSNAILVANEYGIISGYPDGTFRPDALITREEAMAMYQRAMKVTKLTGKDTDRYQSYADYSQVSDWAKSSVKEVLSARVFNGNTAATISPKSNLTYAEAAQAIRNLLAESDLINK